MAAGPKLSRQAVAAAAPPPTGPEKEDLFPIDKLEKTSFAGNGFNLIFRPRHTGRPNFVDTDAGPDDNILELNLTTEQWTFDKALGAIPNRGLFEQKDVNLGGIPYVQTVQKVTDETTGRGSSLQPEGIHFEPGVFLTVPQTKDVGASVVRMASIPHGTTINAQGLKPSRKPVPRAPNFDDKANVVDTTPFPIGERKGPRTLGKKFKSMNAAEKNSLRIPADLGPFGEKRPGSTSGGTGTITTAIIKNPNLVLKTALNGLNVAEHITFSVSTGGPGSGAELNGGGTANIAFLAGPQPKETIATPSQPTAHAAHVSSRFWIETVLYEVVVPALPRDDPVQLRPNMPKDSTAPTPVFLIKPPSGGNPKIKTITVPGIQLQYSQNVDLNFAGLTWPHVSVATLVPTTPQPFQMK